MKKRESCWTAAGHAAVQIALGQQLRRRAFLQSAGLGVGLAALSSLQIEQAHGSENISATAGLPDLPHHLPRAKRVLFLYMSGGPSQLETFDYKPELNRLDGRPMPESFTAGQPLAQLQGQDLKIQGHLTRFQQYGASGQWVSDYLPHQASIVDELCIIRSMVTEQINHDPAHAFMNTGTALSGRPSMGAWIAYGLGSLSRDLPSFVVMTSVGGRNPQPIASRQWSSGFLPAQYQGVEFNSVGAPVHYLSNPPGIGLQQQRELVDSISRLDQLRHASPLGGDIEARIAAYEMAFQMQTSVPALVDMSGESQQTLDAYGATPGDGSYASNCLLARRLLERDVRFVQLYHRGWDHHGDLQKYMEVCGRLTDQPTTALLLDLKQRGLLEDTLVIWGGEFGRTPMFQGKGGPGRDHHIKGFTMWLAGGGIRPGTSFGATDELGYNAVQQIVHVRDLHATMLYLLGIDDRRFSVRHQGLDMRLTGVEPARVLHELIR
ncbi:MAG: DUF1501 domain-containing protein [Pirellulaceae bacterium]|nr:DUF1501 domain-containing protein [Pirellulaceae bacterium]